jgi:deoxyribose-phosphate aldolase
MEESNMDRMDLARYIDHTILKPDAKESDVIKLCKEALEYKFASVCVNASNVKLADSFLHGTDVKVCSVIGFPFGTHSTATKVGEAKEVLAAGADEVDMVINVGKLLEGDNAYVEYEIKLIAEEVHKKGKLLKVIVETCYLNEEKIAAICGIVECAGADFIKTSTGYGSRGAVPEDIVLFKKYLKKETKIKASGGIRTPEDAKVYLDLGCSRLGTSNGVAIAEGLSGTGTY